MVGLSRTSPTTKHTRLPPDRVPGQGTPRVRGTARVTRWPWAMPGSSASTVRPDTLALPWGVLFQSATEPPKRRATHLRQHLATSSDIGMVQECLKHKDVGTRTNYAHALNPGERGLHSPAGRLIGPPDAAPDSGGDFRAAHRERQENRWTQ